MTHQLKKGFSLVTHEPDGLAVALDSSKIGQYLRIFLKDQDLTLKISVFTIVRRCHKVLPNKTFRF